MAIKYFWYFLLIPFVLFSCNKDHENERTLEEIEVRVKNTSTFIFDSTHVYFNTLNNQGYNYGSMSPQSVTEYIKYDHGYSPAWVWIKANNIVYEYTPFDVHEILSEGKYTLELAIDTIIPGTVPIRYNLVKDN